MDVLSKRQLAKPLGAMIALAVAAAPAGAMAKQGDTGADRQAKPKYVREYKQIRRDYVESQGARAAGRNIVRDGYRERDGDVRRAREREVTRSTERMRAELAPAAGPAEETPAPAENAGGETAGATAPASGAPTSVIECESGGDYGAVNPAGYYGAYQFDQGTWNAHAPSGYQGTNPAQAPPAVQDAAAAAVPYDAWPNC